MVSIVALRAILALLAASLVSVAPAQSLPEEQVLRDLQALDQQVATIGYRLAYASRDLCSNRASLVGIESHDLSQYDDSYRQAARLAFGLDGHAAILVVAKGSPADRKGIQAGDTILSVNEVVFAVEEPISKASSFTRTEQIIALLERAAASGQVRLQVKRGEVVINVDFEPEPGCSSRFQVVPGSKFGAEADGIYVQITSTLAGWTQDDAELAAILAHELAHNILHHRSRLDAAGVKRGILKEFGRNAHLIRETEVEADRLSVTILDRAGYPPDAAARLWARLGPRRPWGIFGSATHPGWKQRVKALDEEAGRLIAARREGQAPNPPLSPR
jgi:hypothetical protein